VKNNLQIITSLLNMQIRRVGNGEVESQLRIIGSRVETLRVVHDNLFQAENIDQIPLPRYLHSLCESLLAFHGVRAEEVALEFSADDAMAGVDTTVPLGLLINEFFVNSIQHAFPNGRGVIDVRLTREADHRARLTLTDDGTGFDRADEGFGLPAMRARAHSLGGTFAVESTPGRGTALAARLPLDTP
jgi:two-component sensor histidine kinase